MFRKISRFNFCTNLESYAKSYINKLRVKIPDDLYKKIKF